MNDGKSDILNAALAVFSRYGIKKTTMQDIADEAGVARQTVYNGFANKEVLLVALIDYVSLGITQRITAELAVAEDLGQKLDIFFEHAVIGPYLMIKHAPEAADLEEGGKASSQAAIEATYLEKKDLMATLLSDYDRALAANGQSADQAAEFLVFSAFGCKKMAQSEPQLRRLLQGLKTAFLALLGVDAQRKALRPTGRLYTKDPPRIAKRRSLPSHEPR